MNDTSQFNEGVPQGEINASPGWPTVLGVIGIVWSSLGLLLTGCGLLITPELVASWLPEDQQDQILAEFKPMTGIDMGLQVFNLLLMVLLLWGSIVLLRRQANARPLLNIWAWVTLVSVIVLTPLGILQELEAHSAEPAAAEVQSAEGEAVEAQDGDAASIQAMADEATPAIIVVSSACGGVVVLILPIIMLCFLNSSSGRRTIASWQAS